MTLTFLLLFVSASADAHGDGSRRPLALEAFEQSRQALETGTLRWAVYSGDDERCLNTFVSRYARNGDMIFEIRGDDEGWTVHDPQTGEGSSRYPQLLMMRETTEAWHFQESGVTARVYPSKDRWSPVLKEYLRDVRAVGVFPTSRSLSIERGGVPLLWGSPDDPIVEFTDSRNGDLFIVTATTRGGAVITWHIDSGRGWNAERIEYEAGDFGVWEVVCDLRQYGETWFPEQTRFYENGRLVESIVVTSAEFNQLEHSPSFSPADLGIEPGTNLTMNDGVRRSGLDLLTWNGDAAVPHREYIEDVKAGRRAPGPTVQRTFKEGFSSPYETEGEIERRKQATRRMHIEWNAERHQKLWEQYVRTFIARYALDDEQRQRAWTILLECRRTAESVMAPRRDQMISLISEQMQARTDQNDDRADELERQIAELRKPIDEIFERQLKPRLDKLPTRAQRAAAETQPAGVAAPSSRPARSGAPPP